MKSLQDAHPVHLIETQRLLVTNRALKHRPEPQTITAVENYANDIAKQIKAQLAESATVSQQLDRTFPHRLLAKRHDEPGLTETMIRARLLKLEERRARLMDAGLLDKAEAAPLPTEWIDSKTLNILSLYIQDTNTKLDMFEEIASRIELLKRIVNSRFLYKKLEVNSESGFVLRSSRGETLRPRDLSSGEQHELVLAYELLFKVEKNSLILIDEPELSLHVAWQQQFLRDLGEIAGLASLDFLVATHSPQIIHDQWDIAIELKGPQ